MGTVMTTVMAALLCSCLLVFVISNLRNGFRNGVLWDRSGLIDERTNPVQFKFKFAFNFFMLFATLGVGAVAYFQLLTWLISGR